MRRKYPKTKKSDKLQGYSAQSRWGYEKRRNEKCVGITRKKRICANKKRKSMETLQSLVVQCDSGEVEFDWTYENQKQKEKNLCWILFE